MSLPLARYDEYWRLDTYKRTNNSDLRSLLEQQGSQVKSSASKTELVTLKHRLDCGLLYYNTCTDAELGKFVRERRINVGTSQKRGSVIKPSSKPMERASSDSLIYRLSFETISTATGSLLSTMLSTCPLSHPLAGPARSYVRRFSPSSTAPGTSTSSSSAERHRARRRLPLSDLPTRPRSSFFTFG